MRTVFVEPGAARTCPRSAACCRSRRCCELMAAATEVPLDWQPGTRDGRLMMLLLDELRRSRCCRCICRNRPSPGWRASAAPSCGIRSGRTAWPTGPLNWGGSQDGAAPVPAPYRHDLRRWRQRGCWRRWNGWRAASGCWTWRWTWATRVRAPSRPCSARPWASRPAFAARGGVRLRVAGPARASGRKLARTGLKSARIWRVGLLRACPQARGRGTGVLFSVSPVR